MAFEFFELFRGHPACSLLRRLPCNYSVSRDLQILYLPNPGNLLGVEGVEQVLQMLFQVIQVVPLSPVVRVIVQVLSAVGQKGPGRVESGPF